MKPEQLGSCVKLGATVIPAVNIQVEDVPGYIYYADGMSAWFGIYFEIMFEDGALWLVMQGSTEETVDGGVQIVEYPKWEQQPNIAIGNTVANWEEFVNIYNERRNVRGQTY